MTERERDATPEAEPRRDGEQGAEEAGPPAGLQLLGGMDGIACEGDACAVPPPSTPASDDADAPAD